MDRLEWLEFEEFSQNEKELWNWIENKFALYLGENNISVKQHLDAVADIYAYYC